ncbi:tail assembly chaperone [Mycobacterium phage Typha]|uniref:Tail assembly chaperone n=1 Tax=Mycobacterium phage Typha TaxID=2517971 RepID=A0A482J6P0_9CAUD|nr:tail assembly chaperone [Mycobacterium phage Typha]QBP29677.1 tail assembly chaperone [Mycobacterium phage Typha]URM86464.1 tail assembly chaperone [Mycobacterium phage Hilltopfarm]
MTTPAKKTTARKAAPRKQSPKKKAASTNPEVEADQTEAAAVDTSKDAETKAHLEVLNALKKLYPKGTEFFVFTAEDGTMIPLPRFTQVPQPDRAFFWRIYQMDAMFQGFEWMRHAKVPTEIQAIIVELGAKDYDQMFDDWFADAQLTAGE